MSRIPDGTRRIGSARTGLFADEPKPIDMILHCPNCHRQHVDKAEGEWTNPPHRSHLCHFCGSVWRPADVATNGVAAIRSRGVKDNV